MKPIIAIVFPGQGSQSLGMLHDFAEQYPQILKTFDQASVVLGYDLWQRIQTEDVNQTTVTQPALLTASIALWRLWQTQSSLAPVVMAGHSLGEYTALVGANSLSFETAVYLTACRGLLMQQAVPEGEGAMAAIIGLTDAEVMALCQQICTIDAWVAPANFNTPGQIVIAGHAAAVTQATAAAKGMGAKLVKKLAVSVPSHCALMQSAAEKLQTLMAQCTWQVPQVPVIQNFSAHHFATVTDIQNALFQQLTASVQWTSTIQKMIANFNVTHIIECGPGKVLTGLNKRISNINAMSIGDTKSFQEGLDACST